MTEISGIACNPVVISAFNPSNVEQEDWVSAAKKPISLGELAFANDMRAQVACLAKRVAELEQSNSVLKRSNQDLEPEIDFAPLGRGCGTRLAGQACKFAVFIGLPAAPARAAKSVHPSTHRAPWSPRLDAPPLPSSVVEWRTVQSRTAPESSTIRSVNTATRFRVMVHSWPDLSDAGDRMSPAQIATRIYSGAENIRLIAGV